ncbi:MAG: bifunctional 2-C-methyl-D-erythritol 4-phosphate cytidylyltransferase/2-C-methyl-D-erythritol 2,4-cyclodiphosphate synthase [Rhodobacter sp.]|uniref:bifunctional 2-C-methyl-D-erythritol 4-phosphate cytidylyltransferase/2-C-methyl-D-erythritol 2,4-cyclodiphosphate synthase n=1 Tax=Pararhodobacter sp. TaxID=2127056 RepID=UPI001DF032BF|nr:bifunctional 2-C-methyl-D-erythritol 4-phosphate cytidylyltransferase/2-C-methyl-D-erythritol 2,4-cyclodiphosphate synthase [Pararhodobacter sp.]MCB1343811.1 bifunctional 2-C-methyl-D-erythritol 4-phosphate cytidylyltransferase/2-C-methyl-D-erythritol 2,4-cyclodiphosphate synthase [Paracoccaceae bacterium]MCC0074002.1 bifunctional 2-C-methyl-D-erythritol 4-phosphate cytidylyltransferase/2-C-methyl-D-erythritol 2,4-cyclodiphosphate synthase [Rhodobacter sp.]HPD93086.1 bifunctional 2-C-methyl-D
MTTSASPTAVILVAAGRGNRMGGGLPKQWRDLAGRPVLAWTAKAFRDAGLARLIVAIHPDDRPRVEALGLPWVTGGATRSETVRNALEALARAPNPPERVLIHDGARPLVPGAVIDAVLRALDSHVAAAPALAVTDALWRGETHVTGVQPRDGLFRAQTPQGFRFDAILAAHRAHPAEAADDVAVARAAGLEVWITQGSEDNLKLTYPVDFERAERLLRERQALKGQTMDIRTGNGFDVHAFTEGDHVWLCGVKVPHTRALLGHSDADVGMHALTDALYGALAEGDIGRHFPPSDPQWKGAESHIFLRHAAELAGARGFRIAHCDVTLICERPKIGPHAEAMRAALAAILGIAVARVSVKATTSERLGFTGREEGIAALATATLIQE